MPILNDWDINFSTKIISHVDGVLTYDGGSGTQPAVGEMVRGGTSGAVGRVLSRTGNATAGTLTLTDVVGFFENNETLTILSELLFDGVANGGFKVGDTLQGASSGSTIVVRFIEYNIDGVAGHGKIFGSAMSAAFTNNENLNIVGGTADVADADGTGTDNDADFTGAVDGNLAPPGTTNENNCVILHYDGGTIAIPEDAHIKDAATAAEGYAQRVYGAVAQGSIRVVDSKTSGGAWTNNDTLRILDCLYYNNLVGGKVFNVGDVIRNAGGTASARVIAVIDDGDSTGKLITANASGTWDDAHVIQVKQADDTYVTYADVEDAQNRYLDAATINLPAGVLSTQRQSQGGIYGAGSLNIVRSANAFYTYVQDTFDELAQLDDLPPLEGNVADQLYTIVNGWIIRDKSFRFLEKGSFKDSSNNNIWTNYQTTGVIADIGSWGFFFDATNPTPPPNMYIEQNSVVLDSWWIAGPLDVLVKVKTSTDPAYINPAVNALGQLINGGVCVIYCHEYLRTYSQNEQDQVGGVAVVALGTAKDLNNTTGQYQFAYGTGGAGAFTVGEEITATTGGVLKVGIVTASDSGASGNVSYALKSGTQFAAADVITGAVSGKSATLSGSVVNLVAGYSTNIRIMTVDKKCYSSPTAVVTGTFFIGEPVTQAVTGATGFVLEVSGGDLYLQVNSGTFSGDNTITGDSSGATWNPGVTTQNYDDFTTVPKDIGDGAGDQNYSGVAGLNITNGAAQTVLKLYEWMKFRTRSESTTGEGGPGATASRQGRIYRRFQTTYAEVVGGCAYGLKAGALVIGAQGLFIQDMASADLQNIQLVDNAGVTRNPPNIQALQLSNLFSGVRVAVYRSQGTGQENIRRTEFKVGTVGSGNNQAGDSTILVAAQDRTVSPLPSDVPDSGTIRVLSPNGTGNYIRFEYTSVNKTTNIFTLSGTIGSFLTAAGETSTDLILNDNVHVVLIEQQASGATVSKNIQYVADVPLFVIARIKGKVPFKSTSTFGATGQNIGVVLNPDTVVNLP